MHVQQHSSLPHSKTFAPATSISTTAKLVDAISNNSLQKSPISPGDDLNQAEFASKRWVWVPDEKLAFIKGFVTADLDDGKLKVRCVDDSVCLHFHLIRP